MPAKAYENLIAGIDWFISNRPDVINLSLGPATPSDAIDAAVRRAMDANIPVVVAAGNAGPAPDTLQPLARVPGVVAVGATGEDGELLPTSSRGTRSGPTPAVVACGLIDVPDQRFPEPSTSWAAPRVAAIGAFVKVLLAAIAADVQALISQSWPPPDPHVRVPVVAFCDTGAPAGRLGRRADPVEVARTARQREWYYAVVRALNGYGLDKMIVHAPYQVGLALEMMAAPMPHYERFEAGAGFVSNAQLINFLIEDFRPLQFAMLFCDAQRLEPFIAGLDDLGKRIGPIWDEAQMQTLKNSVDRTCLKMMARVM